MTREEAVATGRAFGLDTVRMLSEEGENAEQRVARAMAYAAWEYDGKPLDQWERYRVEFGVTGSVLGLSGLKSLGQDTRPVKREKEKR